MCFNRVTAKQNQLKSGVKEKNGWHRERRYE
jgi:hypothetical protein